MSELRSVCRLSRTDQRSAPLLQDLDHPRSEQIIITEIITENEEGCPIVKSLRNSFRGGASFSGCAHCGVSVHRHRKIDYTPVAQPMLTGNLFVNYDPDLAMRHVWVQHECDPEKVEKYSALRTEVAEKLSTLIEENRPPTWMPEQLMQQQLNAREHLEVLGELTTRFALTRPCPKCDKAVGEICENLSERKRGNVVATKNAHPERMPYGEPEEPEELLTARSEVARKYELVEQTKNILNDANALEGLLNLVRGGPS